MRPNTICLGPTINSCHFSSDKGHWGTAMLGVPQTKKNVLMIDRNCDMLPLSLDDLLNYTTLMLKFCTNKPIWASLLRQVFLWGVERGRFTQKKGVTLHPRSTDFQEKKSSASSIRIVSYCKYNMYFNKYDMYSIIGIDKKMYGEGIGKNYIHT